MKLSAVLVTIVGVILASPLAAHGDKPHGQPDQTTAQKLPDEGATPATGAQSQGEVSGPQTAADIVEEAPQTDILTILKNLHPATVHFPIALLLAAGLTEALFAARASLNLRPAVTAMTVLGAGGAVIATAFGWYHTGLWLGGETAMQWHRWTGSAIAVLSVAAAWAALRSGERDRTILRFLLALLCLAILPQAFRGAEIAHGTDHLLAAH